MNSPDPSEYSPGVRRFVAYWLQDLSHDLKHRGLRALLPWRIAGCVGAGWFVGARISMDVLLKPEVMLVAYAAALTLNAILLAICWAAFGGIFQILGEREFGTWLRHRKADGHYGFYIDFIHLVQMTALSAVALAILLVLLRPPGWVARVALGAAVGASIYAVWWAGGSVRIMRELAELRLTFEASRHNVKELSRDRG